MIDTHDLTSYYPGYDDYCEPKTKEPEEEFDNYENLKLKEMEELEQQIIDLNNTNMTLEEIYQLKDYVWKQDKLIPAKLLEGE